MNLPLTEIKTVDDVETFFEWLYVDQKLAFHPDDGFDQYTVASDDSRSYGGDEERLYDDDQAETLDRLMDEAFTICKVKGEDIYTIGLRVKAKVEAPFKIIALIDGNEWRGYFQTLSAAQDMLARLRHQKHDILGISGEGLSL